MHDLPNIKYYTEFWKKHFSYILHKPEYKFALGF